jgi:hypothetical protein
MRPLIWIAASVVAAASCGKQLNPEYCAVHPMDVDCANTGMVTIDAPKACVGPADCTTGVCDTKIGQCVECVVGGASSCKDPTLVCDVDDHCHACTMNDASHCGPGGVCLPDDTCAAPDSFLYATPSPDAVHDCSMMHPCDLATAVSKLNTMHLAISLGPTTAGPHYTGGLTIGSHAVIFGDAARGVMGPADAIIDGSLAVGTSMAVALDNLSVTNATDAGVQCTTAGTLTFHYANSYSNTGAGLVASNGCTLNVDRSEIYSNAGGGLYADASAMHVTNAFIYGNGVGGQGQAVRLSGGVTGSFTYSSIGYNVIKKNNDAVTCQGSASFAFNIVAGDSLGQSDEGNGSEFSTNGCSTNQNIIGGTATNVFTSQTNLHLPGGSPAIDAVPTTECIQNDIDGEARPKGVQCDIGADEY